MMANSSAADLLQQLKDFMTKNHGAYDIRGIDNPDDDGILDLDQLLERINHSAEWTREDMLELSDWPFPVQLQNSGIAVLLSAYLIVILASLLGNVLVVVVILRMRRMHTVTNIFILNVAISDIMITILNIPFNLARVLLDEWPFGSVMCRLIPFVQVTAVYCSSWTMVCIAVDRLIVTVYPLRPRMQMKTGIILVGCVWAFSMGAAVPYVLVHETITTISFQTSTRCVALFPAPGHILRQYLSLITFILQFCIPLTITGICYAKISRKLWFTHQLLTNKADHAGDYQPTIQNKGVIVRNRQRSIKMLMLVVSVFALTWLPISLYHLTRDFGTDDNGSSVHNLYVFLLFHWLAMSSVCYNPYIYCCWNSTYRNQAKLMYHFLLCCLPRKDKHEIVQIRGLIVRFKGNPSVADDLHRLSPHQDYRSFNWDSCAGTREVISYREGQRVFKTRFL
ncbi:G-protein coupled receptor 83-like [Paramacrobiotus metropolitanus]|uniref:G-protein coupled receptor 83-like n=1 Tax=Paramacrobiotus metropolitanus TaxID=2943436 RepID=UPI0024462ED9|nr:G-protein coupled receptor 83-like [Paramacrobiotus metropolitanus]